MKIVVIGGGVMGLSCAWRLGSAGAEVMVLESRKVGEGATLAALGALWPASPLSHGPLQELHRESLRGFEDFVREVEKRSRMAVPFARKGRLELLSSQKAVERAREEAAYARAHWPWEGDEAVMEVLSAEKVAEMYPAFGIKEPGLLCRMTAQVRVEKLVAALRRGLELMGVEIREGQKVTGLERKGGRMIGARCGETVVNGDAFVLAAGAWTTMLEMEGRDEIAAIGPVKGQGISLVPDPHSKWDNPGFIVKRGTTYLVTWKDEILVGATTEADAGFDESVTAAAREMLLAGAIEIVPALRGAKVLRQWAGLRPRVVRKPHWPVMGFVPGVENCFVCAGHFKTGIGMSPLVSELVARSILAGKAEERLVPFGVKE